MTTIAMTTIAIVISVCVAVLVIAALAIGIWYYTKEKRTQELRAKFGPEYDRTARAEGGAGRAEKVLQERENRVEKFAIKPLTKSQRDDFADKWEHAQARFVDDPAAAVVDADELVKEVMSVRGYPVVDFDQRAADVSVDHPVVVENYRAAHDIAVRQRREDVGIENLREAMIHYRALFADLLHDGGLQPVTEVVREEHKKIRRAA